jgi:SAM-dependent methyltransferase
MGTQSRASLEALIEAEDFGLEVLHPGGLDTTSELATLCEIGSGSRVLDVATGTGEGALFLVTQFDAAVTGVDHSAVMIERARTKAERQDVTMRLVRGDAHRLPFCSAIFDVAICECTLSLLDKERALQEMVRVVRSGGLVGFHEICWKEDAPEDLKRKLYALEGERPETLQGWQALVTRLGVTGVRVRDRSSLIPQWMKETREQLGIRGILRVGRRAIRKWGLGGLWRILQSERVFESEHLGYGIVVARKL